MTTRQRLRETTFTGYRTQRFGSKLTGSNTYVALSEFCEDVIGVSVGDNQPFTVTRVTRSGGLINGKEASLLTGYIWNDYPCAYIEDAYCVSHHSITGRPTNGSMATNIAARTQPFRAEAVAWEYIDQLHNLGRSAESKYSGALFRLLKVVPRSVWRKLSRAAKINLMIQFGLVPLISDINVLLSFQKRVDSRVKEMERLYGARGLRRTLHLWDGSHMTNISNQTIQSNGVLLHARITKTTTIGINGHIRWYGIFPLGKTDERLHSMATKAIAGTELDPFVIYELMPWSWLVDYFLNLGSLVKAAKNSFTCYHEQVTIMEHKCTRTISSNHDTASGEVVVTCTPMFVTSESKTRNLATPTLNAQESVLTNAQLSILGSLAVLLD